MTLAFDFERTAKGDIHLAILDDQDVLWPHPAQHDGAADFDPEDVLSYLADAWPSLLLSQTWPAIFAPDQEPRSITGLMRAADDRWEQMAADEQAQVEGEVNAIDAFLYQHDLSSMKHGAGLPSMFVLRQGSRLRVEAGGRILQEQDFRVFQRGLERLGATACDMLALRDHPSAQILITRWAGRDRADPLLIASYMTGIPRAELVTVPGLGATLVEGLADKKITAIANDNRTPLYAAARCSGGLGPRGMFAALQALRSIPHGDVTNLQRLRRKITAHVRGVAGPLDQGIRAADIVRSVMAQQPGAAVDLAALSKSLDITVDRPVNLDPQIDGLASIGPRHGPAILLNTRTERRGSKDGDLERSLRFTWAHELGHLLMDGEEWPALIDAALQRIPREVEVRANAFGAYLLLPPAVAFERIDATAPTMDWASLEPLLNQICTEYGVPRILASRQAVRGAPPERSAVFAQIFRAHIPNFDRRGG